MALLGKPLEQRAVAADQLARTAASIVGAQRRPHRCNHNRTAFVYRHVDLVARLESRQVAQRGIEDETMGIADSGYAFEHLRHRV